MGPTDDGTSGVVVLVVVPPPSVVSTGAELNGTIVGMEVECTVAAAAGVVVVVVMRGCVVAPTAVAVSAALTVVGVTLPADVITTAVTGTAGVESGCTAVVVVVVVVELVAGVSSTASTKA